MYKLRLNSGKAYYRSVTIFCISIAASLYAD